jgi:hypothetical protein
LPCVAMSGDAARKSACATHVARTLVFAAFALLGTHGISMLKFGRGTAHQRLESYVRRVMDLNEAVL